MKELKIYREVKKMVNTLVRSLPEMSKMYRFTLGEGFLQKAMESFSYISLANKAENSTERVKYLEEFQQHFEMLETYFDLCVENKLLKINTLTDLAINMTEIEVQVGKWKAYTSRAC